MTRKSMIVKNNEAFVRRQMFLAATKRERQPWHPAHIIVAAIVIAILIALLVSIDEASHADLPTWRSALPLP